MGDVLAVIDAFVSSLDGETRRVADGEWGITVDAAGWPLHVGLALRDGARRWRLQRGGPCQRRVHHREVLRRSGLGVIGLQRHEEPTNPVTAGRQREGLVLDGDHGMLMLQPPRRSLSWRP